MRSSVIFLFACCFALQTEAKENDIRALFDFKQFYVPATSSTEAQFYIETLLECDGSTFAGKKLPNGNYESQAATTILLKRGEEIIDFKKLIVTSPERQDSLVQTFFDLQRFAILPGSYTLEVKLQDALRPDSKSHTLEKKFEIKPMAEKPFISDIVLVRAYSKASEDNEKSVFFKSGYNLIPFVSNYLGSDMTGFTFYNEVYNASAYFGEGELYLLTYYLENAKTGEIGDQLQVMKRQKAAEVTPIIGSFDIEKLATGAYNLVVEMRDRENKEVAKRVMRLQRTYIKPVSEASANGEYVSNTEGTFVDQIKDSDELWEMIRCTLPIASSLEINTIDNTIPTAALTTRQQFFYNFWLNRNREDPAKAWADYRKEVEKVNANFGNQIRKGYETDRGRVYLQYGPPNTIVDRQNDVGYVPYQIWHFYKVENFRDAKFVFYNPNLSHNTYDLIHSNLIGEPRNGAWSRLLRSGEQGVVRDVTNEDQLFLRNSTERPEEYYNNPR